MSAVTGFTAAFRGAAFVARHKLWGYLLAPLVLNSLLAVGAGWLAMRLIRPWLGEALGGSAWGTALLVLLALMTALAFFLLLAPVISAPFVDLLTERVEAIVLGAPGPSVGLLAGAWEALVHAFIKLLLYLFALGVTALLGALTGVGGVLGVMLYGAFLAFDGFDYPLARRRTSFRGKWGYLFARPALTASYATGVGLMYLIPLANLVAPAFAGVGATLLFLDDAQPRRQRM